MNNIIVGIWMALSLLQPNQDTYQVSYYDVTGTTWPEITQNILVNCPRSNNGDVYYAYTSWYISEDKHYTINVLMPNLENIAYLPAEIQEKWNEWTQRIYDHELLHANYAMQKFENDLSVFEVIQRINAHDFMIDNPQ